LYKTKIKNGRLSIEYILQIVSKFGNPCVLPFKRYKFEDSFGFKYLLSSFNMLPHLLGKRGLSFSL